MGKPVLFMQKMRITAEHLAALAAMNAERAELVAALRGLLKEAEPLTADAFPDGGLPYARAERTARALLARIDAEGGV